MTDTIRPTKKQRELLEFIKKFINEHGYSPSYREIMVALDYNSVATVALHVNNLIHRGHLRKRDRNARSLEVIDNPAPAKLATNEVNPAEEKWLVHKIDYFFAQAERNNQLSQLQLDQLFVLVGSLRVLGLEGAAQSFIPRLGVLKNRLER